MRVWRFVYAWASCMHFGQKLIKSTNGNFHVRPRKQVQSWISALTSNILSRCEKYLRELVQKIGMKNKTKTNRCCNKLCVNTQTQKIIKDFWKHLYFNNVYSTGVLSQLISKIASAVIDSIWFIREATITKFKEIRTRDKLES